MDLKPLVLALLEHEPLYGYLLVRRAKARGALQWAEGTVYPLLHTMEREGLVRSRWRMSGLGRRRKYYSVTAAGRRALRQARGEWRRQVRTVTSILMGGSHGFQGAGAP